MKEKKSTMRVAVLDDHAVVRCGIKTCLSRTEDIIVAGSFARSSDLLHWMSRHRADVIVLDYSLAPDEIDGLNLIRLLCMRYVKCKILVLSGAGTRATARMAMRAGAIGFLCKNQSLRDLPRAIRTVALGREFVSLAEPPKPAGAATEVARAEAASADGQVQPARKPRRTRHLSAEMPLSPREYEVLRCFLDGMSISEIAIKFARSTKTISAQKHTAFRKLGIKHDLELFSLREQLRAA